VGAAYCWGSNGFGQLGIGGGGPRANPEAVAGGVVFDRLSSNVFANFHCALTPEGTGYCWGSARHGQLGNDGIPVGNTSVSNVPVPVSGGFTWTMLSPGGDHACGLLADGTAYCWGSNFNGQLGLGGPTADQNSPQLVAGGHKFLWIAAAYRHTCGITVSKAVYCWGQAEGFKVTGADVFSPSPVTPPPGVEFAKIVGGEASTCALTPTGQAYCWGLNGNGQIGDGTTTNRPTPVPVTGGQTFLSLDGRGRTACGLAADGRTYCWGRNDGGQGGTGTQDELLVPTPVFGNPQFTIVSVGAFGTCALEDGAPRCWGPNSIGQVGDGTTILRTVPTRVRFR
jgi:alpha-tubulin suppressor-like RCC1 family protein